MGVRIDEVVNRLCYRPYEIMSKRIKLSSPNEAIPHIWMKVDKNFKLLANKAIMNSRAANHVMLICFQKQSTHEYPQLEAIVSGVSYMYVYTRYPMM